MIRACETPRPAGPHRGTEARERRPEARLSEAPPEVTPAGGGGAKAEPAQGRRGPGASRPEAPPRPSLDRSPSAARSRGVGCGRPALRSRRAAAARAAHGYRARVDGLGAWRPRGARAGEEGRARSPATLTRAPARTPPSSLRCEGRRESGAGPDPEAEVIREEGVKVSGDWLSASARSQ